MRIALKTVERSPDMFVAMIRGALIRRGINRPGTASITVKRNRATLTFLFRSRKANVKLDYFFDSYMDGRDIQSVRAGLEGAIDGAIMSAE